MGILRHMLLALVTVISELPTLAADFASPVEASLVASVDAAVPGSTFTLGLRLKMKPHWHTYWINPGESGAATKLKLTGPAGFEFGAIQWPLPKRIEIAGGVTYGYEDEVLLMVPVKVAADVATGGAASIAGDAWWLCCKETCIEGGAKVSLSLPVAAAGKPANAELFRLWQSRLPLAGDHPDASRAMLKAEQASAPDGTPAPSLAIQWNQPPRKVEWFPVATEAVAVENVVVRHQGRTTQVQFKPTVYKAQDVRDGKIDSVVVFEDEQGRRTGVAVPVRVTKP